MIRLARARLRWCVLLLVAGACMPGRVLAGCCPSTVVAESTWAVTAGTWLGADDLGGVHVAVVHGLELTLRSSRDRGETWEVSTPPGLAVPVGTLFDVHSSGLLVASYREDDMAYASSSFDQARTFTPAVALGEGLRPHRLRVGSGTLAAVLSQGSSRHVQASVTTDGGLTWRPPTQLSINPEATVKTYYPDLAVSETTVVAVWVEREGSTQAIVTSRSADGGLSWSPLETVRAGELQHAYLWLTTTGDDAFQLFFQGAEWPDLELETEVRTSVDGGLTWSAPHAFNMTGASFSLAASLPRPDGRLYSALSEWPLPFEIHASDEHGLPGSWRRLTVQPAAGGMNPHFPALGSLADGRIDVVYEDNPASGEDGMFLDCSRDEGESWLGEPIRLDVNTPTEASTSSQLLAAGAGRLHVLWREHVQPNTKGVRYVAVESVNQPEVDVLSGPGCPPPPLVVELQTASVAWCDDPAYRWLVDGEEVAGETDATFVLPSELSAGAHEVRVEVGCSSPSSCEVSASVSVEVPPAGGVTGRAIDGWLRASRERAELALTWDDRSLAATSHSVYRGTLASLHDGREYDHARLECHLSRSAGATAFTASVAWPEADAYFLVSPADCLAEGTVGMSSDGDARPVTGAGDACGPAP